MVDVDVQNPRNSQNLPKKVLSFVWKPNDGRIPPSLDNFIWVFPRFPEWVLQNSYLNGLM